MTTTHGLGAQGIHYCPLCDKYYDSPSIHVDIDGGSHGTRPVTNGGVACDSIVGPCSCGATHSYEGGRRI